MNDSNNNTETILVMYKTQVNGPWLRFETQFSPERLSELKRLPKKEVNDVLTELIEPSVLGQDILAIDHKL